MNDGDGSKREKSREGRESRYTRDTKEMYVGKNHRANEIQRGNSNSGAALTSGPRENKSMSTPTCKNFFSKRRLTRIWSM